MSGGNQYGFEIICGETPEIHLGILGIAYLDSVHEHSGVLAPEPPYIDCLQTSDSSVVLQLDSSVKPYRIRHIS